MNLYLALVIAGMTCTFNLIGLSWIISFCISHGYYLGKGRAERKLRKEEKYYESRT